LLLSNIACEEIAMNKFRRIALCTLAASSLLFFSQVSSADDTFLKIDGIDGESKDDVHAGEIDVLAWQWDYTTSEDGRKGGGGGRGATICEPISFVHYFDKASVGIALAGFTRSFIPEALLTVRKSGEEPLEYLTITLTDATVISQTMGGEESENLLIEQFALSFERIKLEYAEQLPDGSGDASIIFAWDCKANRQL
jgi:type VI secretion system secreted protein Hcp